MIDAAPYWRATLVEYRAKMLEIWLASTPGTTIPPPEIADIPSSDRLISVF